MVKIWKNISKVEQSVGWLWISSKLANRICWWLSISGYIFFFRGPFHMQYAWCVCDTVCVYFFTDDSVFFFFALEILLSELWTEKKGNEEWIWAWRREKNQLYCTHHRNNSSFICQLYIYYTSSLESLLKWRNYGTNRILFEFFYSE